MRIKFILIAALAVAAFVVAGCGSSGGGGTSGASSSESTASTASSTEGGTSTSEGEAGGSSGKPLTKKEFVKQAEAVCTKIPATYTEKLKALEAEAKKKGKKPTTGETNLKAAVPADYVAVEELEALTPPKGEEQKVEAIIASLEKAAKGLEANPEAELSGPKSPYAEWQKLTGAYGLKSCAAL